jgi:hypothetical protein
MARKSKFAASSRDAGGFVAIPWTVLDSPAYQALSAHARVLLIEIARQLRGDNNGSLLCSRAYLATRGWRSNDMATKARDELIKAKLLHQTVIGHRPNKASWYAVTWLALDKLNGYDADQVATFVRSSYKTAAPLVVKPTRQELCDRWKSTSKKTESLSRPTGQEVPA